MAEEKTDVTDQAVADPTVSGGETETPEESRTVPLSVLKQMEQKLKDADGQNKLYQAQLATARQPAKQEPKQEVDPFAGRPDDDFVSVADQKNMLKLSKKELQDTVGSLAAEVAQLKFAAAHPDYQEVIPKLKETLDADPALAQKIFDDIQNSANPLETAYKYAKLAGGTKKQKEPDFMSEFEKILANQEKPASPSTVGGGGSMGGDKYSGMSDADFLKKVAQVKGLSV